MLSGWSKIQEVAPISTFDRFHNHIHNPYVVAFVDVDRQCHKFSSR